MTGWLGSGIPIPGLRKNEAGPSEAVEPAPEPAEVAEPKAETKDDDDNSRYNRYEGLTEAMSLLMQLFQKCGVSFLIQSDFKGKTIKILNFHFKEIFFSLHVM